MSLNSQFTETVDTFPTMVPSGEVAMNGFDINRKRKHSRRSYDADVVFSINYNSYFGEMTDISLSGAFISFDTMPAVEPDDEVQLTIPYAFQKKDITLKGRVARYAENGIGVEFF